MAISWPRKSTSSPKSSATRCRAISTPSGPRVNLPESQLALFKNAPRLTISACGTAFYACLVGKYWFEQLARLPVEVDVASELRYRSPVYPKGGLALFVSQSGETADTLAALRGAKEAGQRIATDRQCPRKLDRARIRNHLAHLCRAGDRRRLDQGVHLPAFGARVARHRGGARPRPHR